VLLALRVGTVPNFAVVSPFSATVALFCDSVERYSESGSLVLEPQFTIMIELDVHRPIDKGSL